MKTRLQGVRAIVSYFVVLVVVLAGVPAIAAAPASAGTALGVFVTEDEPPPPDGDGDGIPDDVDACPDIPGDPSYGGCPAGGGGTDGDGDGINDDVDLCPSTPGDASYGGCPAPPPDGDGDGVYDDTDLCPSQSGQAQYSGCPDSDGDGNPDNTDACPNEYGPAYDGCALPDFDGDGVPDDGTDQCPNEYAVTYNGCPEPVDSDGDGVYDSADLCPNVFGAGANGCVLAVTPAAVQFTKDWCGRGMDKFGIPTTTGVTYRRVAKSSSKLLAAGTYQGRGEVRIVATATQGYSLAGKTSWKKTFTDQRCWPGRISVTSPRSNAIRVVNRENQPLTLVMLGRTWRVEAGSSKTFTTKRDSAKWQARWDDYYGKRNGSVRVD